MLDFDQKICLNSIMITKEKRYNNIISCNIFFKKALDDIGLKNNYIGYYYLVKIINLLINENVKAVSFYKNIYPQVAQIFNKSVCTVERNIRVLIDNCWNKNMKEILNCKFIKNKPSCCKFILIIKNYILSLIN